MDEHVHNCPRCGSLVDGNNTLCPLCGALYDIRGLKAIQAGQTCFECGFQADGTPKMCPECGAEYLIECPACEHQYAAGSRHCPMCRHDNHADYFKAVEARREGAQRLVGISASGLFIRILIVLAAMAALYFLLDMIDWTSPQAIGGLFLLLLAMCLVFVYVIYMPIVGKVVRERKRRRPKGTGRFAMVYRTLNLPRAEHLRSLLDSEGIPAFIYNQHATTLEPFDPFTGIRVMVPRDRLKEIKEVMEAFGFDTEDVEEIQ